MSRDRRRAGSLTREALQADDRAISNEHGPAGNRNPARRPPLRTRPQSWHPYGPVEPPLESLSSRPIGVHAILNPTSQPAAEMPSSKREPLSLPGPSSSPRPQGSSPTVRPGLPLAPLPLSPRSHTRALMNPGSPSARFVGGGGRTSGQSSVAQSPLVPQEPFMGPRPPAPSSPHPTETTGLRSIASITGTQPPVPASLHSTPRLHSRRTSAGPGPLTNPNSQETSPITPHSTFGQFGRASPAVTSVSIPHSAPAYPAVSPYMTMEPQSRGVPAPAGPRIKAEETSSRAGTPQSGAFPPGMIPCVLDMRSGSSSQAEKRKANSDASRRFRNRKRNEMQLEQRLTAQQEEIQRSMETIRRQSDELRSLVQQRDHYHSERDFYRDQLSRTMPPASLPPRPPSPRSSQPAHVPNADPAGAATWSGADSGRSVSGTQPAPAGPPKPRMLDPVQSQGQGQASWPTTNPPSYPSTPIPPTARGGPPVPSASVSGGPLPPIQGTWPRP
ncbi:uncharacterized protein N7511_010495 [Penicillium nucicola]|uniref:uncharacterized protein n=1 Tax=Penicillium nucicola TaxID=1850975 RepID=UPI002545656B|nr:uncharacterized protein N7511_010495 [Penicillium nucicola]KAJ5748799.1 hypothetical protein N7511_010495 [Penicillium nucicola]